MSEATCTVGHKSEYQRSWIQFSWSLSDIILNVLFLTWGNRLMREEILKWDKSLVSNFQKMDEVREGLLPEENNSDPGGRQKTKNHGRLIGWLSFEKASISHLYVQSFRFPPAEQYMRDP